MPPQMKQIIMSWIRDPSWQFVGVVVAVLALILSLILPAPRTFIINNIIHIPSTSASPNSTPTPSNNLVYQSDWSQGSNGWTLGSAWTTVDNMLVSGVQSNSDTNSTNLAIAPYTPQNRDYAVKAEIEILNSTQSNYYSNKSFGVFIRSNTDPNNSGYYSSNIGGYELSVSSTNNGSATCYQQAISGYNLYNSWHTYLIEAKGDIITCSIDGGDQTSFPDNAYLSPGKVGLDYQGLQINVRSFKIFSL